MISILVYLMFCLYAIAEGMCHAFLYHMYDMNKKRPMKNEHIIYNAMRLMVLGLCAFALFPYETVRNSVMLFSLIVVFSFYHNGMYSYMRKYFSNGKVYPNGWWSDPHRTGSARFNFNNDLRTCLAIGGTVLYFCAVLYP